MRRYIYIIGIMLMLMPSVVQAQIVIGGKVFGGARQANVGGSASVNVAADNHDVLINAVYGGNDISGTIGTSAQDLNAHVLVSPEKKEDNVQKHHIFIGNLFGGGNGDYDYTTTTSPYYGKTKPELGKAKVEIKGGTIAYVYGGGNAATVTEATDIWIDNASEVTTTIKDADKTTELLTADRMRSMGIPQIANVISSDVYHFSRVFGGNNKAEMKIQPTWHLLDGNIDNLYSGGNEGKMTYERGLLLQIPEGSGIMANNVYGGCRKADVRPQRDGEDVASDEIQLSGYPIPAGLSARVRILGGDVNNVYGGNDITGDITGGCSVGVYTSIRGNIYGGGNGSYPYTDNADLAGTLEYGDYYYGDKITSEKKSVQALNDFRPDAEQVSIYVAGTEAKHTIIGGAIYVGGNSATLSTTKDDPLVELKIGSYVYADKVFLGNNGEYMVNSDAEVRDNENKIVTPEGVLRTYSTIPNVSSHKVNSINFNNADTLAVYMEGCAMTLMPNVVFVGEVPTDPGEYDEYSTYFGSFYCGGNVGSMNIDGLETINFNHKVIIFDKLVGGCNNAYVNATDYNAAYPGGVIGAKETGTNNKIVLNLSGLKIEPKRWVDENYKSQGLEWNTVTTDNNGNIVNTNTGSGTGVATAADLARRLTGGNIYGGCCESGVVNGNVVINLNATILELDKLFDEVEAYANDPEDIYYNHIINNQTTYTITTRRTGVIRGQQVMDALGSSLNVFGGGKGIGTEIWGSTTINHNKGYVFQIFGGSEEGVIGKPNDGTGTAYTFNGKTYKYNEDYSCYVNMNGTVPGASIQDGTDEDRPECEYIYGGGLQGPVLGNGVVHLDNGRVFGAFGGSCDADILGHTELYIGNDGFPWIRDMAYGGNDLGGEIKGTRDYRTTGEGLSEVRFVRTQTDGKRHSDAMLTASSYVEYRQGRADAIYGGNYGTYDYENDDDIPIVEHAFVNFRPTSTDELKSNTKNVVNYLFGGSQGAENNIVSNSMQKSSYVLIDIPQDMENYKNMQVFGAGSFGGLGMKTAVLPVENPTAEQIAEFDQVSAIVDLVRGQIDAVYGGSYKQGITRRTVVNVPIGSTIRLNNIFGGAYGLDPLYPCDVYEAQVNYHSANARVSKIYGGNNFADRVLYGQVNIHAPVWKEYETGTLATVFGAGYGADTWSQYTEVNLENNARVWEVYGGGNNGKVLNTETMYQWRYEDPTLDLSLPGYEIETDYEDSEHKVFRLDAGLNSKLVHAAALDGNKYNTNIHIKTGATVENYAYAGGLGADATVSGTTYIDLLGGEVKKDIYAGGTSGSVEDIRGVGHYDSSTNPLGFTASATAYIKGGTVRNVYGGGWRGSVGHHGPKGHHTGQISDVTNNKDDIDGKVYVVIGDLTGDSYTNGIPSITRNVYGGGEGGAIFGDAYVTVNKGYIGYRYNASGSDLNTTTDIDERYEPELDDVDAGDNLLDKGGNVFGGGYVANSYVDRTHVTMRGGIVRGSLYGGGEIGPVGRGTVHPDSLVETHIKDYIKNGAAIYKGGETHVELWDGHVMRDVFGGGRGYDNWGGEGWMTDAEKLTMDKSSKGYVFGSTEVHIYGGEVGTESNVLRGFGNVFAGGNEGFVYSATGTKSVANGYYYDSDDNLTRDCYVAVEPKSKVKDLPENETTISVGDGTYKKGDYVPLEELNKLKNRNNTTEWNFLDTRGVTIHNALFAGGNITEGSDKLFANTVTVYGNAAASIRDVYNIDLISLGTEEMGGLYGDGNLTLVDGLREIHVDNYGTDYYSLKETMTIGEYNELEPRQQAYYKLKYGANETHTYEYWESKALHTYKYTDDEGSHEVSYRKGQKITPATYEGFGENKTDPSNEQSPLEKDYWVHGTKSYQENDQIEEGEYSLMDGVDSDDPTQKTGEKAKWTLLGVTSIYAGRPMNTIQRTDLCGVFGSRLVLKGAVDRAPQVSGGVDYNSYTINRVDELSLNKRASQAGDQSGTVDYEHGNYFGIYSSVKYLGNLTSDVPFLSGEGVREAVATNTDNTDYGADGTTTYYTWKADRTQGKYRNNGISHNKVALASGVYLEIKREESESSGTDVWGYVTGVIELDLINVMPGMGGGYVYAKNEHRTKSKKKTTGRISILTENSSVCTWNDYDYGSDDLSLETSGNFVHKNPQKQIVDDCYPNGGVYSESPAHFWYIRGSIYVYDQYLSAYTGAANATAEKQEIPLNITAASNGKLTLRDVKPNYYAYYDKNGNKLGDQSVNADTTFVVNNVAYKLNQPISYWDYQLLSEGDRAKFVNKTYVVIDDCKVTNTTNDKTTEYKKGEVLLEDDYNTLKNLNDASHLSVTYVEDDVNKDGQFTYFFRSSNNLGHDTGYLLTYDVNNPMVWNNYYTETLQPGQANAIDTYQYFEKDEHNNYIVDHSKYTEGPTYTLKSDATASVYGQQDYIKGNIIYGSTVTKYKTDIYDSENSINNLGANPPTQATVERAWVMTKDYSVKDDNTGEEVQHMIAGTPVYQSKFTTTQWAAIIADQAAEEAKVCTSLLEFSATEYVWAGKVLSSADITSLKTKVIAKNKYVDDPNDATNTAVKQAETFLNNYLDDAYYCTSPGKYGGINFKVGRAYSAIDTWCSMPYSERTNFQFNYDALDLLIDPDYSGEYGSKQQYDGNNATKIYSDPQAIDYTAEFVGYTEEGADTPTTTIEYTPKTGTEKVTITKDSNPDHWLTREAYESIPNEKRNYSPIIITSPGEYYMVRVPFINGEMPYTLGQQIDADTYESLGTKKDNVDVFNFTSNHTNTPTKNEKNEDVYAPKTYYYCRKGYIVDEKGEGKLVTTTAIQRKRNSTEAYTDLTSVTYDIDASVPQGVIIPAGTSKNDDGTYSSLCNFQKGFSIHGTSPTEVSTLYVSNESDIHDLSTEKIITVVYLYEYDESDETGLNVTPVSERHIINIHINFKSGVPEIGDITKPDIVLPGTTLGMNIPSVTEGAYRVTESGWEIFSNDDDAATHYNGVPFTNNETPLYYYQNGYSLAYYAQTSLGKTYSKSVKLSVANYHDLKKVMDDKNHHYYIDHLDVDNKPKVYINDYQTADPATSQNGLNLLKNLIDLSYVPVSYDENGNPLAISGGALDGHMPMASRLQGGRNLEFFLRTDLSVPDTEAAGEWTPIANAEGQCFNGILHGDGHTISGLDNSLINHLCGKVYNLGVSGSFTSAGIADSGGGRVENCWIKTTGTPAENVHPLFGYPQDTDNSQVVNCYYLEDDESALYTPFSDDKNMAVKKSSIAFKNGEVAYNLNGFYLNKRYYEGIPGEEPEIPGKPELTSGSGYVKGRFADGDFIYADGSIPSGVDERALKDNDNKPILDINGKIQYTELKWPDDYLFFGQALNYGVDNATHQNAPSAITADNRVYRAPAYFGDSNMGVAYYNKNAVFAKAGYEKGMTAIDFTGYNDVFDATSGDAKAYQQGLVSEQFYAPLLDDEGLTGFNNVDMTRNLLVYTPASSTTTTLIQGKHTDKAYTETNTDTYRTVAAITDATSIQGHWVKQTADNSNSYVAVRDHFLVDKEDFFCPIAYTFTDGTNDTEPHRMWYQRTPGLYVDRTKGWEGVSLPFTADIVTTQQKGELTHFYGESSIGHEYWLRGFAGNVTEKDHDNGIYTADFNRPAATGSDADDKVVTNTFLWDYYYNETTNPHHQDFNTDEYQTYYKADGSGIVNTFTEYPRLTEATPYIIGFPGKTYYEFDLSGQWTTNTTATPQPVKLQQQVITFASKPGIEVAVSDASAGVTADGYTFHTNYMKQTFEAGTAKTYALSADGSSFDVIPAASTEPSVTVDPVVVDAFRPYFTYTAPPASPSPSRDMARSIVFSNDDSQLKGVDDRSQDDEAGGLVIYAKRKNVVVESNLRETTEIRIINVAGITLQTFTIEPGETVKTPITNSGVYIVRTTDGRHIKKLSVK